MKKIVLMIEDYTDQRGFESLLRRLGFDCSVVNRDVLLGDTLLSFIPDLIVVGSQGRNVDFKKVESRLLKLNTRPKMVFMTRKPEMLQAKVHYLTPPPNLLDYYDGSIELPVDGRALVKFMCKILALDQSALIEKYEKLEQAQKLDGDNSVFKVDSSKSAPGSKTVKAEAPQTEKEKKFSTYLKSHPLPGDAVIASRGKMQSAIAELAQACEKLKDQIEEREKERKDFVRKLYLKAK